MWFRRVVLPAVLVSSLVSAVACGPNDQEVASAAKQEAFSALQAAEKGLAASRAELNDLEAQLVAQKEAPGDAAADAVSQAVEQLETSIAEKRAATQELTDGFINQVVTFLNENPMFEGELPDETQAAVIRMKSSEDLLVAMEHVDQGGDWARAEGIISDSLKLDPDNETLKEKLAWVQDMRYVTKERFDQIKNGMSPVEVKALLGQPNLRNIRDFGSGRSGWFFPKDAGGNAAGVYFEEKGGKTQLYKADFEAIKRAG